MVRLQPLVIARIEIKQPVQGFRLYPMGSEDREIERKREGDDKMERETERELDKTNRYIERERGRGL